MERRVIQDDFWLAPLERWSYHQLRMENRGSDGSDETFRKYWLWGVCRPSRWDVQETDRSIRLKLGESSLGLKVEIGEALFKRCELKFWELITLSKGSVAWDRRLRIGPHQNWRCRKRNAQRRKNGCRGMKPTRKLVLKKLKEGTVGVITTVGCSRELVPSNSSCSWCWEFRAQRWSSGCRQSPGVTLVAIGCF